MAIKPVPGLDVPVVNSSGQMNQAWYEFYQSLLALLNSTVGTLSGVPALIAAAIAATVASIDGAVGAITLGYGLSRSSQNLRAGLTSLTNSIGADVALNNVANYFDGPVVAQGTTGTWFVSGTIVVLDTAQSSIIAKLWDGTTVIASTVVTAPANFLSTLSLSGVITSPAGNLRISARDATNATGLMKRNSSTQLLDSTITAVRIA